MRRFANEMYVGVEIIPPCLHSVVHAFDLDDTLTCKPEGFDNTGMTKDQFFDASRDFEPDVAVKDVVELMHMHGDAIAITTARPPERLAETVHWQSKHDIPFDQVILSQGTAASSIAKQAMLQKLQDDYHEVGVLFDDSPYNIEGARLQGISAIHLRKNDEYWAANPEDVYRYEDEQAREEANQAL